MQEDIILEVKNLSKQYRLGLIGTGTISHDLNRLFAKIRGKEDPFLKLGETNDRSTKGDSNYVWALKDINFEVKRGEVLGIIGKNGAGKSTLLKILSKVTGPSTGTIRSKGRIASLLEVGTGFHPEMTGKENVFLNGAILGMTKNEIKQKLSEIISFSGCERYIDTPVKRYSSGMKVRLAFAVAAFLEPDILVIDEVLAVGDIEFQKKAIGKMQDISKTKGRTVLFVSHDMNAIQSLCKNTVLLENGTVKMINKTDKVLAEYYKSNSNESYVKDLGCLKLNHFSSKQIDDNINFSIIIEKIKKIEKVYFDFAILDQNEKIIVHYIADKKQKLIFSKSLSELNITISKPNLKPGTYYNTLYFYDEFDTELLWIEKSNSFTIINDNISIDYINKIKSATLPKIKITQE